MLLVKAPKPPVVERSISWQLVVFLLGAAAILVPTMYDVGRTTWTTEQGGHAPIIVATGLWLLWREFKTSATPMKLGNAAIGALMLVGSLLLYVVARITGILEIEGFAMYAAILSGAYLLIGGPLLRSLWFPIVYLAVALPPPDQVVTAITQPLKIGISEAAVSLLRAFDYPIAGEGVTIQIANYQLFVAAACAGLNSIISLSAICLFYVYLRHRSDWRAFLIVGLLIIPIAIFSNFIRVLVLILITYYSGEAAAQGFMHDFAGLTLFIVALLAIFGADALYSRLSSRKVATA